LVLQAFSGHNIVSESLSETGLTSFISNV